jgi:hypothetical protein
MFGTDIMLHLQRKRLTATELHYWVIQEWVKSDYAGETTNDFIVPTRSRYVTSRKVADSSSAEVNDLTNLLPTIKWSDPMRWMIFINLPNPSGRTKPRSLLSL